MCVTCGGRYIVDVSSHLGVNDGVHVTFSLPYVEFKVHVGMKKNISLCCNWL